MQSVRELSKAGMNIMCLVNANHDFGDTGFLNLLDTAYKHKVYLIMGASNNSFLKYRAEQCKAKPALFGYTLADDADDVTKITIAECKTIEAEIKAIDNMRLTHLTLTGWESTRRAQAKEYIAIPDFCSYQCYPIGHHRWADITETNALKVAYDRTLDYVKEADLQNKPFVHTPQTFTWVSQSDIPRYPTVVELRNMVYSALAAGVKGFISYDFSFDLVNNQKLLWKEYSDLGADVKGFKSILFAGTLTRHETNDGNLVVSTWKSADTILITVVNTSYSAKKNVSITLSSPASGTLSSISPRLATGLSISNGKIVGSIAPQSTYVYKLIQNFIIETESLDTYKASVALSPNPAQNKLFINGNHAEQALYEITTMEGKVIQTGIVSDQIISVENIKVGIYIIKIKTDSGSYVHRLIKE